METITTPLPKQIDHLLKIFKGHQSFLDFNGITKRMNETEMIIEGSILLMLLEKLERDKMIYRNDTTHDKYYCISYEGSLFHGYVDQIKIDTALDVRHNVRDFVLSWGTVLAGIAASLLLIWQVYSFLHPVPGPCEVINSAK